MIRYDVRSPRADDFINHQEILDTLAYAAMHRHDAALAGNAEFLRKVAADSGDGFDRFHYLTSTEGTSTPESCIVCIMCRCAACRARSLSCSRIPRYISKWHWLAR